MSQNPVPAKLEPSGLQPQKPLDHYLSDAALKALSDGVAESTRRGYREDLAAFIAWCEQAGRTALPATAETLTEYAAHLINTPLGNGQPRSPASIERARSAIRQAHRAEGVDPPDSLGLAKVVKGYRARLAEAKNPKARQRQATAASVDSLAAMLARLDRSTDAGARDAALILLGFVAAARRSELASMNIEDVTDDDDGLTVTVYRRKTHEFQDVPVSYAADPALCPVVAVREWIERLAAAGRTTGPLFVRINKHGHIGPRLSRDGKPIGDPQGRMTPQAIRDVIGRKALTAALSGRWTGHSLRRGYATEARRAGATREDIARGGGWAEDSPTLNRYIEASDARDRNPMKRVL